MRSKGHRADPTVDSFLPDFRHPVRASFPFQVHVSSFSMSVTCTASIDLFSVGFVNNYTTNPPKLRQMRFWNPAEALQIVKKLFG